MITSSSSGPGGVRTLAALLVAGDGVGRRLAVADAVDERRGARACVRHGTYQRLAMTMQSVLLI